MFPTRSMSSVQSSYPVEVAYSYPAYCLEREKLLHSNPIPMLNADIRDFSYFVMSREALIVKGTKLILLL